MFLVLSRVLTEVEPRNYDYTKYHPLPEVRELFSVEQLSTTAENLNKGFSTLVNYTVMDFSTQMK